jgi:O-antigen/teichoic acid export membrane protein
MSGWTLAKYLLALSGVLIVILADKYGVHGFGWIGLGLVLAAFFLRFWQRARARPRDGSGPQP